jgi:lipoprotein-anchoring transpeptidase ErfK/SrfK
VKATLVAALAALALLVTGCASTVAGRSAGPVAAASSASSAAADAAPSGADTRPVASALALSAVPAAAPVPQAAADVCAANTAAQFVLVVISAQHAWMCEKSTLVYDTPVTTGEVANGNDTPTGTWHIQSRQGARYLTLLNGTRYHVDYWLPYDDIYGFHDAAWQTFPEGSDLYKTAGSHGCVHLPETAMAWLAGWANVGATVTIRN